MTIRLDVAVVGSVNQDLTIFTSRHPRPGETILGRSHRSGGGGKGANQAVAATRLGARTAFIGRIGRDDSGRSLRAALQEEGLDLSCLSTDPEAPTGLAVITVDDEAENSIVVSPGANSMLSPALISMCEASLAEAAVVLAQLEVPVEAVEAAARVAQGRFLLNPAPATSLPGDLLDRVDVLIPNGGELAGLTGDDVPSDEEQVVELARKVEGPSAIVVTLGSRGAMVIEDGDVTAVPAPVVEAVDTTGAGDAFCGALAEALSRELELTDAVRWAARAGALAATRRGAQSAMPTRSEMEAFS